MNRRQEAEEKVERLVRLLAAEGLGGVLLAGQHNFAWATGGGRNGIDLSKDAGACSLFVRADGRRFVLANRAEMPRLLEEELRDYDCEPVEFEWEAEKADAALHVERARALANTASIGADMNLGDARVIEASVARARYSLTEAEIERYRLLGRDAGEVIGDVARALEPGLSEREIARCVIDALAARDISAPVVLVAADERMKLYRHPVPTAKRWKQSLMIVVCAKRAGLIASLSRIVCAKDVPNELHWRTEACAQVGAQLFDATRPGVTGRELYTIAARSYCAVGFSGEEHAHHQGGAAGYRTREWIAHPAGHEAAQPRQAFAWNPTIAGAKIEETCIIGDNDQAEIITASPGWEQLIVKAEAGEYCLPGVHQL